MSFSPINFLRLSALGFSLAAPLGPVNMEMIKQGVKHKGRSGTLRGFITGIGAMSGDFTIAMTVLFIGASILKSLLEINEITITLFLGNTFILLYIGFSAFSTKIDTQINPENLNTSEDVKVDDALSPLHKQYFTGLIIVITSPWSYLWWASFGPVVLNMDIPLDTLLDRFITTIMFLSGIFTWLIVLAIALNISSKFASNRIQNYITKGSALIIIYFGFLIFYQALKLILKGNFNHLYYIFLIFILIIFIGFLLFNFKKRRGRLIQSIGN